MEENATPERCLLVRSRVHEEYRLSEFGLKNLQHVLTDWFPRGIYADLTDDTASVDIVVRRDGLSNKGVLGVTFLKSDGSVIKRADYSETHLLGRSCAHYDPKKTRYDGKQDGFDRRLVFYTLP